MVVRVVEAVGLHDAEHVVIGAGADNDRSFFLGCSFRHCLRLRLLGLWLLRAAGILICLATTTRKHIAISFDVLALISGQGR